MLARVTAALFGVALFAGTGRGQETTIKFTLGWKTQGPMPPSSTPRTRATSRTKASTS